jgi:Helix-turn-helix domain
MQPTPLPPKRAYEIDELVQQGLGSRSYLYEQINGGALRAVKRGRRTIILEQDLATWLSALPAYQPGHRPRQLK